MTENTKNASVWAALDPQLADDRAVFPATRVRELLATDREQAPRSFDDNTLARLRRVLAQMGLGGAVAKDDATLSNTLFSVFGMMAGALERREAFAAIRSHDEIFAAFKKFSVGQGYDLTTCEDKGSITTESGVGPATFWKDATEHAWRGWANRPGAEDYRDRAHSAERGCYRAGLLFDPATREWMPPARHPSMADQLGAEHRLALRFAQLAACSCLTKTPEIAYHRPDCRYRVFAEIEQALFGPRTPTSGSGQRHECTPKNGGTPYTIDRAPDSWELRECDIRLLEDSVAPADLKVWEPAAGEDVPVSVNRAIARAAALLVSMGHEEAVNVASHLAYLLRNPGAALAEKPDNALLASMATCLNHGFGLLDGHKQESMLYDMRKLYDEVTGRGYYRGYNRSFYTQWLSPVIEGGERKFLHSASDYRLDKKAAAAPQGGTEGQAQ